MEKSIAVKKRLHNYTGEGYALFIFMPLLSLISAFRNYREAWAKNIVWLFSTFFGFAFVIGNVDSDVNRYKEEFLRLVISDYTLPSFIQFLFNNESVLDYLQPLISFFVSRFTTDFRVVLAIFGAIFGFFYSRNIWSVLSQIKGRLTRNVVIIVITFSFMYAVWDINVLRFTLASQILFYGIFNYFITKRRAFLLIALLSTAMHFTMGLALLVFLLYRILGNSPRIYLALLFISLFSPAIDTSFLRDRLELIPTNLREETSGYLSENYVEYRGEKNLEKNFRGKFYQDSLKWGVVILLFYSYFNNRKWFKDNPFWVDLYCFSVLFITFFNFLSDIPSMNRFLFLGSMFALAFEAIYFSQVRFSYDRFLFIIVNPLLLFYLLIKIRIGFEFTGLFTVFGNPIIIPFINNQTPLVEYFK